MVRFGRSPSSLVGLAGLAAMLALGSLALAACDSCADPRGKSSTTAGSDEPSEVDAGVVAPSVDPGGASAEDLLLDAGRRFRDGGGLERETPVDPACAGKEIAFASVITDARCAVSSARAKRLRDVLEHDGGIGVPLKQEAKVESDGHVTLRLVNTGAVSVMLPLSFSRESPAFTVLAEDEQHTVFELEAPRLEVADAEDRPRFARIQLAPGAAAVATIAIPLGIARIVARAPKPAPKAAVEGGSDAGGNATRLAKGHYTLYVGELLVDVEAGAPARVSLDVP
jgi:hypothetical protein